MSSGFTSPNLIVLQNKALKGLFSVIRDKSTPSLKFAAYADRIHRLVSLSTCEEDQGR